MPRISTGGVSDVNVDPDYVAPPGMAPEQAIEMGIPSAGQEPDDDKRDDKQESDNRDNRDENDKRDDAGKQGDATQRLGNDDVARPTVSKIDADSKTASARKTK
jgi:hypothetical protein